MAASTSAGLARINKAAVRVIGQKGFARATTQEIASQAGVSEGLIFRYYKTKFDLGLALFSVHYRQILDQLRAVSAQHAEPGERFRHLATTFYEWFDGNREVAQFLIRTHHDFLELTEESESVARLITAALREVLGETLYTMFPGDILTAMVTGAFVQVAVESTHGQVKGPLAPRMALILDALGSIIPQLGALPRDEAHRDGKPERSRRSRRTKPARP